MSFLKVLLTKYRSLPVRLKEAMCIAAPNPSANLQESSHHVLKGARRPTGFGERSEGSVRPARVVNKLLNMKRIITLI